MADDLPPDVRAVLTQLFAEGQDALAADDRETAVRTVTTAETVATNKLPEGAFRDRLLHGCERVRRLLETDADHEPPEVADSPDTETTGDRADAAAAYLTAMEQRVADENRG